MWLLKVPTLASAAWKGILRCRSLVKPHIQFKIGNGKDTFLWLDPWLEGGSISENMDQAASMCNMIAGDAKVADLVTDGVFQWPGENSPWINALRINPVPPIFNVPDTIVWKNHQEGAFSVKKAWEAMRDHGNKIEWHQLVWKCNIVPKWSFITWTALWSKLCTQDQLKKWGIQTVSMCVLCRNSEESAMHIMWECTFAKEIWIKIQTMLDIHRQVDNWDNWIQYAANNFKGKGLRDRIGRLAFCGVIYYIWKERNARTFNKNSSNTNQVPPALAHMGTHKNANNASDSFLTLMRNLEILIMNRTYFCKRQVVKLEEKVYQLHSEDLILRSNSSSFLSHITRKSDMAYVELFSTMNTTIADNNEVDLIQKRLKMNQKNVDDVINHVYTAPLLTSSSNPSRDLCSSFFTQFQLLEDNIDRLGEFDCDVDSSLEKISMCLSKLMRIRLLLLIE